MKFTTPVVTAAMVCATLATAISVPKELSARQTDSDCYMVACIGGLDGDASCAQACGGICNPASNRCINQSIYLSLMIEARQQGFHCSAVSCLPELFGDSEYGDKGCKFACGGKCDPSVNKCVDL